MTKAKWVHKWVWRDCWKPSCGAKASVSTTSVTRLWKSVTCPKCLSKRPTAKQPKTNLSFELDGKVFVVERTEKGKVVSQEEIDGEIVLKLLVYTLEDALREDLAKDNYWDVVKQENKELEKALDEQYEQDRKARKYVRQ